MMPEPQVLVAAGILAGTHLLAGKLRFISWIPRSRWLSLSSGISVAYVFMHLLPELQQHQRQTGSSLPFLDRHVYLAALVGLAAFYGLELLALRSRRTIQGTGSEDVAARHVFVLHMAAFAVYNAVVAEILVTSGDESDLFLFTLALAVHFVVVDYGLRDHHKRDYDSIGRYLLAGTFVAGFVAALLVEAPELLVSLTTAFLIGGIVLNVLKEEMPAERQSSFSAFAGGLTVYALLLLIA